MFGIFKRKTEIEKLHEKYNDLQKEAYRLSTINRAQSDQKQAEAHEVLQQIEALERAKAE